MAGSDRRARPAPPAALAALALAAVLPSPTSGADVFSPGSLARAHADLEGLTNCTKCHVAGKQLAPEKCLDCHLELKGRVARGQGFHGRLTDRACEQCHHEHQGRDFALVDWGPPGRDRFDHARSGFPLRGKHAALKCEGCHETRRIGDGQVKEMLAKQPRRHTYLGVPVACAGCHFDDHRGQLGLDCQRCHTEQSWKPAPGFNHARAAYPLEGRHRRVACDKCHPAREDPVGRQAFPAAVSARFLTMKPLPHGKCLDCHRDPHQGRFGPSCISCHSVENDWRSVSGLAKERAFHERTRYPLRGAHVVVTCKACHGPFPGQRAKYKGMAFDTCGACHADAHVGQLAKVATCDRCHSLQGFAPARYELEDHARTRYPLEGAHRAVACSRCHPPDPRLEGLVPVAVRADLERRKLPLRVSLAVFQSLNGGAARCETCHRDVHAGQFAERTARQGCRACHQDSSFRDLKFNHNTDSRFRLEGKHAQAECGSCHRAVVNAAEPVVRYRPLDMACLACHADVHAGQFAVKGVNDCARCHGADAWKKLRFVHEPPFTAFRLEGKHLKVACVGCHRDVPVATGAVVRRFRPVPTRCEACHVDFHRGAFRELAQ